MSGLKRRCLIKFYYGRFLFGYMRTGGGTIKPISRRPSQVSRLIAEKSDRKEIFSYFCIRSYQGEVSCNKKFGLFALPEVTLDRPELIFF